jgi:His-Xaa-Ser system protein HxsD
MGGATDLAVEFDAGVQSLGALQAAAYRLIGTATCQIDQVSDRFVCRLTLVNNSTKKMSSDSETLRTHFLNLVTDENLRERIAARTEGVRNAILSLAFGSLQIHRTTVPDGQPWVHDDSFPAR